MLRFKTCARGLAASLLQPLSRPIAQLPTMLYGDHQDLDPLVRHPTGNREVAGPSRTEILQGQLKRLCALGRILQERLGASEKSEDCRLTPD